MSTKIFLFDFDGTIVTEDILDVVCDIVGKKEESRLINKKVKNGELKGLKPLCDRINFLKGVSYQEIKEKLSKETYLRKGTIELFDYLKKNNFTTILSSGNIIPVLKFYQELLNIDYIFGTSPKMNEEIIERIDISDFSSNDFKYDAEKKEFYCYHCGSLLKGDVRNTVCESCSNVIKYNVSSMNLEQR